jgi:hypothetical protein
VATQRQKEVSAVAAWHWSARTIHNSGLSWHCYSTATIDGGCTCEPLRSQHHYLELATRCSAAHLLAPACGTATGRKHGSPRETGWV